MLSEQLMWALVMLVMLDYIQLESISDEGVRQATMVVGKSVPLYALVDKFDRKDHNSDDEEQVWALISSASMQGGVSPKRTYPVSSTWDHLTSRTRHELTTYGRLSDHQEQHWARDLIEAVLGRRWRTTNLDDMEHTRHAVDLSWEGSLSEQSIQRAIHAAYANALLYMLRSVPHKLLSYA